MSPKKPKHIKLNDDTLILFNKFKAICVGKFTKRKKVTDDQVLKLALKKALNLKMEI